MKRGCTVRATRSFERNLATLEAFFGEEGAATFDALLAVLSEQVLPLLSAQPGVGRPFLARGFGPRGAGLLENVRGRLGAREVREYVVDGLLLLYLVAPRTVYLLALRDQRQVRYALE